MLAAFVSLNITLITQPLTNPTRPRSGPIAGDISGMKTEAIFSGISDIASRARFSAMLISVTLLASSTFMPRYGVAGSPVTDWLRDVSQLVGNVYYHETKLSTGLDWEIHVFPFFSYGETPDGHWWNVLFGLAGYTRRGELSKMRTLWIPITLSGTDDD